MDGYVLAGGASRRMGTDKARVPFPGRWPMAVSVAAVLRSAGLHTALVRAVAEPPWASPDGVALRVVAEAHPTAERHPLYGVEAALRAAVGEFAFVAPCDVPFLTVAAVNALRAAAPSVAVNDAGDMHPLLAVFPTAWAERAGALARAGDSARAFAAGCRPVRLPAEVLVEVNRWADAGRPGPVRALAERLAWLPPAARAAALAGEVGRLAARGAVDPEADPG